MEEGPPAQEEGAGEAQGRGEGRSPQVTEFSILGVDHVTVTAPEELESEVVTWYRECLGLEPVEKPEGSRSSGAWFRAGSQEVHISVDPHNPPRSAHFGLRVDDFDAVIDRLRNARCHIEQARPIPGRHRCFTRDPAGNSIEIVNIQEESASVNYEEL
jgi:catechol 2,3-dioxygenase-like lactoylglutathione lyase family enzyme